MATIPIGETITLTKEDVEFVREWAETAWTHFLSQGRTPGTTKENIFMGKLAELGKFKMYLKYGIQLKTSEDDIFIIHDNYDDGGCDLILKNNLTEDVKSIDANKPGYYQVPVSLNRKKDYPRADAYSLCWVDTKKGTVKYAGILTSKEIVEKKLLRPGKRNDGTGKPYYYFDKAFLKQLDENFEDSKK